MLQINIILINNMVIHMYYCNSFIIDNINTIIEVKHNIVIQQKYYILIIINFIIYNLT